MDVTDISERSNYSPSALKAVVGRTMLKPSDSRSFEGSEHRGEKNVISLKGELVLIKRRNNKNILNTVAGFIPGLAKAVLTLFCLQPLELWHFTPGEDPTPRWLFGVFLSL